MSATDFAALMKAEYKAQKQQQKSEDIIEFIRSNWPIFCAKRRDMDDAVEQLGVTLPYSVDSLCSLLAMPADVWFKRSPVADITKAVLNFKDSAFHKLFEQCRNASTNGEACLFIVAGTQSLVITNMQTSIPDNCMVCYYKTPDENENDIHIFKAKEANVRLATLFQND